MSSRQGKAAQPAARPSTMSRFENRQLDRFYFLFFIWHIPISLCVDFQAIYPPAIMRLLASTPLPAFIEWYKTWSRDPIIVNAAVGGWEWDWIRGFMWVEALFQMPCWIVGAWCLWHNDKRVYPLLLAYGASTTTTLLPTLQYLLNPSIVSPPLSTSELGALLSSYIPFLLIPLTITLDMGWRLIKIIGRDQAKKRI